MDYKDTEAISVERCMSYLWMLENDITGVLDLTFCDEVDECGATMIVDLVPNGREVAVTEDNKHGTSA